MELQNKAVVITGASSGIGLEIAHTLAAEGARLALAARSMDKLEDVAAELAATGVPLIIVPTDVTREADCQALVRATLDAFGRVDVLINNAGYAPPASLLDTTENIWDSTLNICLKGVYLMTRAAVEVMLKQGEGTVLNISSVAGKYGFEDRSAYCAAKWGVHGFTEALRVELGSRNIRFHLICPGSVATSWWETNRNPQPGEIKRKMIRPEEVADAVRWVLTKPERIQIDEVMIKPYRSPWE
ncbi:MAG: SDR family oxidoreductase [Anaerolineales bacterium]|nr:SDR family oxidoreductase [Anaerolineales bacterium]